MKILDILPSADLIAPALAGTTKTAVLRELAEHMARHEPSVDAGRLVEVLWERERLGSTAIGDGIAIPHVRAPAVFHQVPTSITLCYLEHPVDFGAPDGRPVHTLFSIVSPNIRGHLELLAKLAAALHDPRFKAALGRRAGADELLAEVGRSVASKSSTKER